MSPRQLRQKLIRTESQIIASEMILAVLRECRSRALQSARINGCYVLALAISKQIQDENMANLACKAEHEYIVAILSKS